MSIQRKKKAKNRGSIEDLNRLKIRISQLPSQYPYKGDSFGSGAVQAKQQIPIICKNIDDAISALRVGWDTLGNPITPTQVGNGLERLVGATRNPGFIGLLVVVLSPTRGIKEFEKSMDDLENIAVQIKTSPEKIPSETTRDGAVQPSEIPTEGDFSYKVSTVFKMKGKELVVTGQVTSGSITPGEVVEVKSSTETLKAKVVELGMFGKQLAKASAGEEAGLTLEGIDSPISKDQVKAGMIIRSNRL